MISKNIFVYAGTIISSWDKIVAKNEKVFPKLNYGTPAIAVKPYRGDTLQIVMGSVSFDYTTIPLPLYFDDGGLTSYWLNVRVKNDDVDGMCWFNTFLKDGSYEIAAGVKSDPEFLKMDQLKETLKEQDVRVHKASIFRYNNKLYLGYIPIDTTRLVIVEIN